MAITIQLIFLVALFVLNILFVLTIVKTLKAVAYENRTFQPDQVWFLVIPIINYLYAFIIAKKLSQSVEAEFRVRNLRIKTNRLYYIGLLFAASGLLSVFPYMPKLPKALFSLVQLASWIIYWVIIAGCKRKLEATKDVSPTLN